MHGPPLAPNTSSSKASDHRTLTTPRSGSYLRTQVQYQLHNSVTDALPLSSNSGLSKTPNPVMVSSPTPIYRQPSNYKHAAGSILPSNLKSITSSVISGGPTSFSAAAASTTASQLSTVTIAGPVFSSVTPRATWQKLELDSMASMREAHQPGYHVAHSKKHHTVSPQRQHHLAGPAGVAPKSCSAARECIVEARRIVQHFVSGSCSEAAFCSVFERSTGHERWALLRVLKELLGNAANSEEHCESLLLVRAYHIFIPLPFLLSSPTRVYFCRRNPQKSRHASWCI